MKKLNCLLGGLALLVSAGVTAQPTEAEELVTEINDPRWVLTPALGGIFSDQDDFDAGFSVSLSLMRPWPTVDEYLARHLAVEFTLSYADLEASLRNGLEDDYKRLAGSAQLMYFFTEAFVYPAKSNTHWYVMGGGHVGQVDFLGRDRDFIGPFAGTGFIHDFGDFSLRVEARMQLDDISFNNPFNDQEYWTVPITVGLHVPLGPPPKIPTYDDDGDGVPNNRDKCPNTPPGVKVDAEGCPLDSDGDGVPDHLDKCPGTPPGVKVNADGCPLDSDGDGIPDTIDKCPDTPKGVIVNADGCPLDSDGDGVPDGIDQCPDTLPGVKVNSVGCAIPQIYELRGVHFEYDKSRLMIDSQYLLDRVARSLINEPDANFMVAGHTCDLGSDAYNQGLSQRRAQSVVDYLVSKGVPRDRLVGKGFGEKEPVKPNTSEANREYNRRTELRFLGTGSKQPVEIRPAE